MNILVNTQWTRSYLMFIFSLYYICSTILLLHIAESVANQIPVYYGSIKTILILILILILINVRICGFSPNFNQFFLQ